MWLSYIYAHGLKFQGEGRWGYCQILGGRVYRGCENFFGGGYTFLVFYCIFINKFCKNLGGRVHFYLPSPLPLVCIYAVIPKVPGNTSGLQHCQFANQRGMGFPKPSTSLNWKLKVFKVKQNLFQIWIWNAYSFLCIWYTNLKIKLKFKILPSCEIRRSFQFKVVLFVLISYQSLKGVNANIGVYYFLQMTLSFKKFLLKHSLWMNTTSNWIVKRHFNIDRLW